MDEFGLRTMLGNGPYEAGYRLYSEQKVRHLSAPLDSLSLFDVDSHVVLVREYDGDRPALYDCDCSEGRCDHIAAVIISTNLSQGCKSVDDPADIERIEDLIDTLYDDITSDSRYDENEDYDGWGYSRRYRRDDESNSYEAEYDYTSDILCEIKESIHEPENMARLLVELFDAIDAFECSFDGFESATDEYQDMILTAFSHVSGKTLAGILAESTYKCDRYLEKLLPATLERAYPFLEKMSVKGRFAKELYFKHGNYDAYLNSSWGVEPLITVLKKVLEFGDVELGRRIFEDHYESDGPYREFEKEKLLPYLKKLGMDGISQDYSYDLFLKNPCEEYYSKALGKGDVHTEKELLDHARGMYLSNPVPDYDVLSFILGHDPVFVKDSLSKTGFVSTTRYGRYRDLSAAKRLFEHLVDKGFYEEAAVIGRGIVDARIHDKDNKNYGDGVAVLKAMGKDKGFESIGRPHSRYLAGLKADHPRMRKFWGLYDGTWHD
ncbi:MAG: hypothetical protein MJZ68_05695 [archaeon]|nr:hypothetical protein [archaeon]